MYSNTISLRYFFPRARILNEIAEFEKMPLNRKTLFALVLYIILNFLMKFRALILSIVFCKLSLIVNKVLVIIFRPGDGRNPSTSLRAVIEGNGDL